MVASQSGEPTGLAMVASQSGERMQSWLDPSVRAHGCYCEKVFQGWRRFFAEATGTLLCAVYGKRERRAPGGGRHIDYWISDGIYGVHAAVAWPLLTSMSSHRPWSFQ